MKNLATMVVLVVTAFLMLIAGCDEEVVYMCGDVEAGGDVLEFGEEDEFEGTVEPVSACTPQCSGTECGDDGCGGTCGSCSYGETCSQGSCMSECAFCTDTECGWQMDSCESNYECGALLSCASSCSSDSCIESCIYSYMGGADDLMNLLECMDNKCYSEC